MGSQHLRAKRGPDVFSDEVPSGQVVSTQPAAGQVVPYGSSVDVVVSKGPVLVSVPDLRGFTLSEAQAAIQQTGGLGISINGSERPGEVVVSQSPRPHASVPLATTTVTLTFGPGPRFGR